MTCLEQTVETIQKQGGGEQVGRAAWRDPARDRVGIELSKCTPTWQGRSSAGR